MSVLRLPRKIDGEFSSCSTLEPRVCLGEVAQFRTHGWLGNSPEKAKLYDTSCFRRRWSQGCLFESSSAGFAEHGQTCL